MSTSHNLCSPDGTFIGVLERHILLLFSQLVRPNMYSTRVANARIGPFPSIAFHLVIEYTYTCTHAQNYHHFCKLVLCLYWRKVTSFLSIRPDLLWKCYFEQGEHRKERVVDGKVKNYRIATGKPTNHFPSP